MTKKYVYRPVQFYATVFACTWFWWLLAILSNRELYSTLFMLLGLLMPAATAVVTVLTSKSDALKADFRRKLVGFYKIKPLNILLAVLVFAACVAGSILLSLPFGGAPDQFSLTEDFSFSGPGAAGALATILLASVIEEVGWRGYGEDAVAEYMSWFQESLIFGVVWSLWHLPLFWVPGTYQMGLRELGFGYVLNFFISGVPLDFLTTWVYVKNGRSMMANMIFHVFVNTMQEKIAMTPETKCIETVVIALAAALVVLRNKEMFFETKHVGRLLEGAE